MAAGALSACQDGGNPFTAKPEPGADAQEPAAKAATSVKLVDRDVEAPEVFQTTDMALWDGRPSLGGVWVASPDAKDPERVILRNTANGKFVIGALFRRERDNPGPKLQLSSDAAEALGLLAGAPGKVSVTALRREEAPAVTDARKPLLDAPETAQGETPAAPAQSGAAPAPIAAGPVNGPAVKATPVAPAAGAKPTPAKPAAPAPAKPAASGAYTLQIGIFSVEANAERAVATLKKAGVSAAIRSGQTQGKPHWSVTATGNDKTALLAKVKSLGFTDAYFLKK